VHFCFNSRSTLFASTESLSVVRNARAALKANDLCCLYSLTLSVSYCSNYHVMLQPLLIMLSVFVLVVLTAVGVLTDCAGEGSQFIGFCKQWIDLCVKE